MRSQQISLRPYLWRFTWVHVGLSAAVIGLAFLYERMTGHEPPGNAGYGIAILFATAYAAMHKFVTCQGRAPGRGERWRLTGGSIVILYLMALAFYVGIFFLVFAADLPLGFQVLRELVTPGGVLLLAALMLVVTLISLGILLIVYGPVARKLAARLAQRPATA